MEQDFIDKQYAAQNVDLKDISPLESGFARIRVWICVFDK